jgi:hypothetical protein
VVTQEITQMQNAEKSWVHNTNQFKTKFEKKICKKIILKKCRFLGLSEKNDFGPSKWEGQYYSGWKFFGYLPKK